MKNIPFIPILMVTSMIIVIVHGHLVSRRSTPKAEHSIAAGVDAHLTAARKAFVERDDIEFNWEINTAIELLSKEAYCKECIDKEIAQRSLQPLIDIRQKFMYETLRLELLDEVFGHIITSLAKNHLIYTLEHLNEIEDEFYLKDAVRHLKYSMNYVDDELKEKEKEAKATLEKALSDHEIDEEKTRKVLEEVVDGI